MRERLHSATIFDWLESILARVDELAPPVEAPGMDGTASPPAARPVEVTRAADLRP